MKPDFMRLRGKTLLDRRLALPGLLALLALLALISLGFRFSRKVSHDVGWMLTSANQWLDGAGRLYDDIFFEVNPPLALFLKLPVVLFSRATSAFEVQVLLVYVFLLAVGSWLLSFKLLAEAKRAATPGVDSATCGFLLFGLFLGLFYLPGPEFGQREHFLIVFASPYLVLLALRTLGAEPARGTALTCGALAALGFALKPHFLLVPLVLELYLLIRTRNLYLLMRAEILTMAAVGCSYAAVVAILTPEYLTQVLPVVMALYNKGIGNSPIVVLVGLVNIIVPLAAVLHLIYRRTQGAKAFGDVFLLATLALYLVYLVQMKGWAYHALPAMTAATCTLLLVAAALLRRAGPVEAGAVSRGTEKKFAAKVIAITCIFLVATIAVRSVPRAGVRASFAEALTEVVETHAPGGTLYAFSSHVSTGFPAVNYSGGSWASRYSAHWILPALAKLRHQAGAAQPVLEPQVLDYERDMIEAVIADLSQNRPDLILVDAHERKAYFGEAQFDYIAYFSEDARFRRIWRTYEQVDAIGKFLIYKRRADRAQS